MDSHDLFAVLDQFFHRRARYDSVKWHPENVAAGKSFIVPPGKIYEVYVYVEIADGVLDSENRPLAYNGLDAHWMPSHVATSTCWAFDKIDPATGAVTYSGSDPVFLAFTDAICMESQGWILSENQSIHTASGNAFTLIWRDVTHLQ